MAERNSRLKKYRDGLEVIIGKAMDYVQESAEMAHLSSTVINGDKLNQCQHEQVIPDSQEALGLSGRPENYGAHVEFNVGGYDNYMTNLLSDIQSFPLGFQAEEIEGYGTRPGFSGVFTDEIWASDELNQHMLDGFG